MRGGAGRTRTSHQSVMEHGSSPTNSPGRTPIQIAGRFAVLLDFPGFLILESTTRVLWNMVRVRPTTLVGHTHPDRRAFVVKLVFKESGSSPTSPPRRIYSSLASVLKKCRRSNCWPS